MGLLPWSWQLSKSSEPEASKDEKKRSYITKATAKRNTMNRIAERPELSLINGLQIIYIFFVLPTVNMYYLCNVLPFSQVTLNKFLSFWKLQYGVTMENK